MTTWVRKHEIPILALFAMRSPCWTGRISLKFYEIPPEKKRRISQVYPKKWTYAILSMKKKWTPIPKFLANFDPFWGNLWIFCKIKQIFTIFNSFWSIKWTFFSIFNLFSSFFNFFEILSKMAKINKKSLVNPMNFLFLSLEIFILEQKAFKNAFYKNYSI